MRRVASLLLAAPLAACATPQAALEPRPTYTRADLESRSTVELAGLFLAPEDAAQVTGHEFLEVFGATALFSGLYFYLRSQPQGEDICARDMLFADLAPVEWKAEDRTAGYQPVRLGEVRRHTHVALAPGCAALPGRRFAVPLNGLSPNDGVAMLRTLAAARAAASGSGPLPFRLSCVDESRRQDFDCPADVRGALAALPVHQAFTLERNPFPHNCDHSVRDEADAIEIGGRDESEIWDVRMRRMGSGQAELAMIRRFPRTQVKC